MAWVIWLPCFVRIIWQAPWRRLADADLLNVWLGMVVLLSVFWSMKAGVRPGLELHFLGATIFTLTFGPLLAFVGLSFVLLAVCINLDSGYFSFALNSLLAAGFPVYFSHVLYRMFSKILPRNLFVYIFVNGFFGAAATVVAVGILSCLLLRVGGVYDLEYLASEYLPYFMLLGFSEAWLSGMILTLFVVYRPAWVVTFDDSSYLVGK